MRIGIVGESWEPEVKLVHERLAALGAEPLVLDLREFPAKRRLEIRVEGDAPRLFADGRDLSDVAAWYFRVLVRTEPLVKGELTLEEWTRIHNQFREWVHVENQKQMAAAALTEFLNDRVPCVNPPRATTEHLRKPHQVWKIRAAGLPVPDFTVTNDPEAVRAFLARHPRVVYKPVAGGRHTLELDLPAFEARADALRTEPILVQALAEGRHCRAFVVDGTYLGAGEVLFDKEARMDYRASTKGAVAVDLPAHVRRDCERAAEAVGMPFTGLDVIWDDQRGTHAFLECNPSPMFANFERMTGVPVSEALARLLVERAKGGATP